MSNRSYAQYADKPNITKWFDILPSQSLALYDTAQLVRTSYDINSATSYELDVIGRIVNQPRDFESFVEIVTDQFGDDVAQFGGTSIQFGNSSNRISQRVSDDIYKILIRAKIAKNNSDATIESVLSNAVFISSVSNVVVVDREDMSFGISFVEALDEVTRYMFLNFNMIPKPQGVRFLGFVEEPTLTQFGAVQFGGDNAQFNGYF